MAEYFPNHDGAVFLQTQEEIESLRQFMSRHSYNEVVSGISAIYRMDAEHTTVKIIDLDFYEENTCFIPEGQDWRDGLNDQIAYGDFKTMKKYCGLIENIRILCESGVVFHPETLLSNHLQKEGVKIKRFIYNYRLLKD
jgi:hypothetical protein